ncbi:hypothetical protein D9M68_991910 [compost metagenome]
MHGEAEGTPVHRQKGATAEQLVGFECVLRAEVDVAPRGVEGADFEHDEIEGAEALADQRVFAGEAGVAAEEDGVALAAQDHGRPERGVAVFEAAP